jgi:glycosyltransferase involved in cell wall biosynthesis
MSTLRLVFLTGEYPPMQGGIADHTAHLAAHLAPLGVASTILISRRWQPAVHPSPLATSPVHALLPNWGWGCWPAVAGYLQRHRPDVLHIQYQAAAFELRGWINGLPWYLKKRGITTRLVTTFHDLRVPYIFPKAGPLRRRAIIALARYSDAVICTNRADLDELRQALPDQCLSLIPLGSNIEPQPPPDFERAAWRAKYQADEQTLLLAYFGFLNESKGGEELIEALALLRGQGIAARLLLIGGDVGDADPTNVAYAERVRALIARRGLSDVVHFTGYTTLAEVSANLLVADVVVMPYRDGVSFRRTTLIAALRHGCPVVSTTPAAPLPEIVPDDNMVLAPPGDAAGLAGAIAPLAGDAARRAKLSAGAAALGRRFEWEQIAAKTLKLYRGEPSI